MHSVTLFILTTINISNKKVLILVRSELLVKKIDYYFTVFLKIVLVIFQHKNVFIKFDW